GVRRVEVDMISVGRCVCAVIVMVVFAEPALAAKPSKKDIANCGADDVDTAIAGCTAIFKKSPQNPAARALALYNRGLAYYRSGDYQNALADHDQAIAIVVKANLDNRNL